MAKRYIGIDYTEKVTLLNIERCEKLKAELLASVSDPKIKAQAQRCFDEGEEQNLYEILAQSPPDEALQEAIWGDTVFEGVYEVLPLPFCSETLISWEWNTPMLSGMSLFKARWTGGKVDFVLEDESAPEIEVPEHELTAETTLGELVQVIEQITLEGDKNLLTWHVKDLFVEEQSVESFLNFMTPAAPGALGLHFELALYERLQTLAKQNGFYNQVHSEFELWDEDLQTLKANYAEVKATGRVLDVTVPNLIARYKFQALEAPYLESRGNRGLVFQAALPNPSGPQVTQTRQVTAEAVLDDLKTHILPGLIGKEVQTLVQKVPNEILALTPNYVEVLSRRSRTGQSRKVYFRDFEKIWRKEIEGVPESEVGRINHGRIIQALYYLHPAIDYDGWTQTLKLRD